MSTMDNPTVYIGKLLSQGAPCPSSYWCGATREELAQRMAERRHVQALPSDKQLHADPAAIATFSWNLRRLQHKMAQRRAGL